MKIETVKVWTDNREMVAGVTARAVWIAYDLGEPSTENSCFLSRLLVDRGCRIGRTQIGAANAFCPDRVKVAMDAEAIQLCKTFSPSAWKQYLERSA